MIEHKIKHSPSCDEVKIRMVKLIPIDDKRYILNGRMWKRFKSKRKKTELDQDAKNYSKLSYILEKAVRHWTKSSDKRVLYWEEYDEEGKIVGSKVGGKKSNWKRQYMEIDFITEIEENNIIVGEFKTQLLNSQGHRSKLAQQFERRKNLLSCVPNLKFEFVGITAMVEQSEGYTQKDGSFVPLVLQEFKEDFFENDSIIDRETKKFEIKKIKLSAKDLIDYGIKNNIIEDKELLEDVYRWIEEKN